jgi:hypothetical protein
LFLSGWGDVEACDGVDDQAGGDERGDVVVDIVVRTNGSIRPTASPSYVGLERL